MSTRADGSIIIDTKINTEKASSQMLQLENRIVKTADRITDLTKKMQQLKNAKVPTEEYQEIATQISKAELEFDKLLAKQEEMQRTGRDSGTAWESLQYKMEQIGNTIRYAKGELQDLVERGQAFTLGRNTVEYAGLSQNLKSANREMNALCRKHEELEEKQKKNTKEYSRMGKVAGNTSKKAGSFLKGLTSGFKGLNKHVKTGNGLFGQMGTRLKGIALSLLIFNWISKGWNAMISGMKEGIQNLAKYSDEFNRSMSELKSSTEQAKNALATAFAPLISALIPYIVGLINIVNNACDAFARFWAYLSGKSTYTKARKQNEDYADSLDAIADSAKNALGALAGFDELNVISQNESSNSSSGAGSSGDLFEEVPIGDVSDWLKKLKEAILAGDWYSVGELIGQKLTEAMESINWEAVYSKAKNFGKNLALFLNGLISPELFGAVGKTIAGALNTAIYVALSFAEEFDFYDFGVSLATAINKFFKTFDFESLADTLNTWVDGLKETIRGFVKTITWDSILEGITNFLGNLDLDTVSVLIGSFWIKNTASNLMTLLKEAIVARFSFTTNPINIPSLLLAFGKIVITSPGMLGELSLRIDKMLEGTFLDPYSWENWFGELLRSVSAFTNGFTQELLDAISQIIQDTFNYDATMDLFRDAKENFKEGGVNIVFGVIEGILGSIGLIIEPIGDFFVGLWNAFCRTFGIHSPAEKMKPIGKYILLGIIDGFTPKGAEFKKAISEWYAKSVKPWFTAEKWLELWNNVKNFFAQGWNNIVSWWTQSGAYKWYNNNVKKWFAKDKWTFNGIKEGLSKAFNDAVDAIKEIWNTFKEWIADKLSFDFEFNMPEWGNSSNTGSNENNAAASAANIPHLADGAVIRGGSPFMAVLGDQPVGQTNIETPLSTIVDAVKQAYTEMGAELGGEYTFIAQLNGNTIFKETVRRNQMYKKQTGQSAYS